MPPIPEAERGDYVPGACDFCGDPLRVTTWTQVAGPVPGLWEPLVAVCFNETCKIRLEPVELTE